MNQSHSCDALEACSDDQTAPDVESLRTVRCCCQRSCSVFLSQMAAEVEHKLRQYVFPWTTKQTIASAGQELVTRKTTHETRTENTIEKKRQEHVITKKRVALYASTRARSYCSQMYFLLSCLHAGFHLRRPREASSLRRSVVGTWMDREEGVSMGAEGADINNTNKIITSVWARSRAHNH